jgi:hypothetical protein
MTAMQHENEPDMPEINTDKVCFIIAKSRELLSEDAGAEADASNPTDDGFASILTDAGDRSVRKELLEYIEALDVDERNALVALAWIGRGDFEASDWRRAVREAGASKEAASRSYLFEMPMLPDFLADALSSFDRSCRSFEEREEPGI